VERNFHLNKIFCLVLNACLVISLFGATNARAENLKERNFYQVLQDLLSDFEFDLKGGKVSGIRDLAVRNIVMSENVPPSFKNHLELVVAEKVLAATKTRMVQCLPCRSRRAVLGNDQVRIVTPENNPQELARIAKMNGIQNFMDVAFSYQNTSMMLSLTVNDAETGSVLWSRSYDSETSRTSSARKGVDPESIERTLRENEYVPTKQWRVGLAYFNIPDVTERSSCLSLGGRFVERYDQKRKEVGLDLSTFIDTAGFSGETKATTATDNGTRIASSLNLTMLFMHAWNFFGSEENYNRMRGTAFIGVGGTYAPSFLGGLIRTGYEWRLAKHWAVNLNVGYRPTATTKMNGTSTTVSGVEFGFGVSALF
jgi:hypothetical protein